MFLLLMFVAALAPVPGAFAQDIEDVSACPVVFFGKEFTTVGIVPGQDLLLLCFLAEGVDENCFSLTRTGQVTVSTAPVTDGNGKSICVLTVSLPADDNDAKEFTVKLESDGNKGTLKLQAGMSPATLTFYTGDEDNSAVKTVEYTGDEAVSEDVTGCRHDGRVLLAQHKVCTEGLEYKACSSEGILEDGECSGQGEVCRVHPNSKLTQCFQARRCALVGPMVVDFAGTMGRVPDLCSYTLLKTSTFSFTAELRDRLRTDVGLLHRLNLTLTDGDEKTAVYTIGPGLQVQKGDSPVELGSQAEDGAPSFELNGASWMLIKVPFKGDSVLAAYDGNAAVSFSAFEGAEETSSPFEGLCKDVSKVEEQRDAEHSPENCEEVQEQPEDESIDCPARTERCSDLMSEDLVSGCPGLPHFRTAFKDACVELQCKYPEDEFCSFIGGLSNLCDPQTGSASQESAQCSAGGCASVRCRDSEFCQASRCRCRAQVLKDFNERETVCEEQKASVSVPLCLLSEKSLDEEDLHLNEDVEACKGTVDEATESITFSFDHDAKCGTELKVEEDRIEYTNKVQFDSSSESGVISRKSSFSLDFSCFYNQPEQKTFNFKIKGAEGLKAAIKGSWPYQINVGMFSDLQLTKPIDFSKGIQKNKVIYISMETDGLDGALLLMKADDCYATDQDGTGGLKHPLITGGCGNSQDSTIKVFPAKNNRGTVMRIKMFQFKGKSNVFLKCKMKLCVASSPGCQPDCESTESGNSGGKRRRSVETHEIDEDDTGYFVLPL